jgi:hypothetical protein
VVGHLARRIAAFFGPRRSTSAASYTHRVNHLTGTAGGLNVPNLVSAVTAINDGRSRRREWD